MNFGFLAPFYLLGILGIGVPIILHLLHRRPQRIHDFPTLRFLLKKKMVADRQRNLKRLLILLFRTLAIAALVLAFAYPILKKLLPRQPLGRVVILDNSASMGIGGRWQQAILLAKRELLTTSGERVSVAFIDFARSPHIADFQALAEKGAMQVLGKTLPPSSDSTNPAEALRAAARLLMEQPFEKREVVLISDFAGDAWASDELRASLPKGITLRCAPLGLPPVEGNLAVTDVQTPRSLYGANEAVSVKARVHNYSSSPREMEVSLNWGQLEEPKSFTAPRVSQTVLLPALADLEVEFNFLTHNDRYLMGEVQLKDPTGAPEPFAADNSRSFVIPANKPLRIARLHAKAPADPAAEAPDVFLKTVFAPFFEKENRRFAWQDVAWTGGEPLKLTEQHADLVLADQGLTLNESQAAELATFVKGDGKLLLFLGGEDRFQDWEGKLLGGAVKLGRERHESGALRGETGALRFSRVRLEHPLLAPFAQPGGGNIFATEVRRWREFTLTADRGEALISTDNDAPLVALLPAERGQVMLWAFPPDRAWTDWPLQTTFLPFLYRFTELGAEETTGVKGNYLVGDPGQPVVEGKSGTGLGMAGEGKERTVHAVNLDPRESELNPVIGPELLPTLAISTTDAPAAAALALPNAPNPANDPSANWVLWLLAGMLIFSVGELLLANRTAT